MGLERNISSPNRTTLTSLTISLSNYGQWYRGACSFIGFWFWNMYYQVFKGRWYFQGNFLNTPIASMSTPKNPPLELCTRTSFFPSTKSELLTECFDIPYQHKSRTQNGKNWLPIKRCNHCSKYKRFPFFFRLKTSPSRGVHEQMTKPRFVTMLTKSKSYSLFFLSISHFWIVYSLKSTTAKLSCWIKLFKLQTHVYIREFFL